MSQGVPDTVTASETAPAPSGAPAPDRRRLRRPDRHRLLGWAEAYALLALLIAAGIFFSILPSTSGTFPTEANLQAIAANQAVIAVVALAALLPLVCGEWDLSVGANAGLSAVFAASALGNGAPIWLAVLIALGVGIGIGILNALIVTQAKVNAVIATLGMATILEGALNQKTGGLTVASNIPASITDFGSGKTLGIPDPAWAMLVIAVVVWYVLAHTPVGRHLYALGSNAAAARLVGLRTRWLVAATFIGAGALAGLAGFLQVTRAGGADPKVGLGFTLPALAAAFLSAAAIKPGRPNVWGTIVAIFFLATLNGGLNLAGSPSYVASYVNGAALIVGVALASYLGRRRAGVA
jgi:ribose transport system permease protein